MRRSDRGHLLEAADRPDPEPDQVIDLTAHRTMGLRDAVQADVNAALATVVHAFALQVACTALSVRPEDSADAAAAAWRAALVQAGAPAALVAAAHEAVRAGHAGVLEDACWALWKLTAEAGDDA